MFKFLKRRQLRKLVDEACIDGTYSDPKHDELMSHARALGLSEKDINEGREWTFRKLTKSIIDRVNDTMRFSPDDEFELMKICGSLQIEPQFGIGLEFARKLWRIENEPNYLPEVLNVKIPSKIGEKVYAGCPARWSRLRRISHYLFPGKYTHQLVELSNGTLNISNKRILFLGYQKTFQITYGRIVNLEIFSDGFAIHKTSGPVDYFSIDGSSVIDYCTLVIKKFIQMKNKRQSDYRKQFWENQYGSNSGEQQDSFNQSRSDNRQRQIKTGKEYAHVLGLQGKVTLEELKNRYRELSRQYHPDKVQHLGQKLQDLAEQEMKAINEAFEFFETRYKQ